MKDCSVCHQPLREIPKYGVLLDICPGCRGVWLDRGELEKVVSLAREFHNDYEHHSEHDDCYREHRPEKHYYDKHHSYPKHKKKRGIFELFEDLFD